MSSDSFSAVSYPLLLIGSRSPGTLDEGLPSAKRLPVLFVCPSGSCRLWTLLNVNIQMESAGFPS